MRFFLTQYALSKGLIEVEGEKRATMSGKETMIEYISFANADFKIFAHKPDWYETEDEAKARVREMITAKRKSIKKQLKRLAALEASL